MAAPLTKAAATVVAAGAATLGWALIEAQSYALRRYTVPILPAGAKPVKILHLSDLHLMPGDRRRIEWVKALAEHSPDLVITTGDNIAHTDALPALLEAYSGLLDVPGAFVTGSNDYYLPVLKNPLRYFRTRETATPTRHSPQLPVRDLISSLASGAWTHLDNARARITVGGLAFDLVGTGDAHIDADRYPPRDSAQAPADITLGVTHAPYERVLSRMRMDGVHLAFAGHTHGGQVCLPFYGALVTNCDIDRRMAKGLHQWPGAESTGGNGSDMWLHVSAGLGTSPFTPIRFACRPEASLLTLAPAAN